MSHEEGIMKRIKRGIGYLITLSLVTAGCATSQFNLTSRERTTLEAVRESRVLNAREAPTPSILPETHYAAARLFEEQGQIGRALDQYQKAVALNPKYVAAHHRIALLLSKLSRHDEAIAAFQRAVALKPSDARLRNNYGFELMFVRRWAQAEAELHTAIDLEPKFARAYVNLAMAVSKQGRFDEALAAFQHVLPEPDAYYNLGLLYRGQREYGKASTTFQHVLSLNPNFTAARKQLAELEKLVGRDALGQRAQRFAEATPTQRINPVARSHVPARPNHVTSVSAVKPASTVSPTSTVKPKSIVKSTRTFWKSARQPNASATDQPAVRGYTAVSRVSSEPLDVCVPIEMCPVMDDDPTPEPLEAIASIAMPIEQEPDCPEESVVTMTPTEPSPVNHPPHVAASVSAASRVETLRRSRVDLPLAGSAVATAFARGTWADAARSINPTFNHAKDIASLHAALRRVRREIDALRHEDRKRSDAYAAVRTGHYNAGLTASPAELRPARKHAGAPTALSRFSSLQLEGAGAESLTAIVAPRNARRTLRRTPKSMLVKDKPVPQRKVRRGRPRTDARNMDWLPPFTRVQAHDPWYTPPVASKYLSQAHQRVVVSDAWLRDFDELDGLISIMRNEILCQRELKAEVSMPVWREHDEQDVSTPDPAPIMCPLPDPVDRQVCNPAIPDQDTDTVIVGDARAPRRESIGKR